jgi:hypothetical protein
MSAQALIIISIGPPGRALVAVVRVDDAGHECHLSAANKTPSSSTMPPERRINVRSATRDIGNHRLNVRLGRDVVADHLNDHRGNPLSLVARYPGVLDGVR